MKKIIFLLLVNLNLLFAAIPATYMDTTDAFDIAKAESNVVRGELKRGESYHNSALWLVTWGDSSIQSAAQNGGIKKIVFVDKKSDYISFFGLFGIGKYKTIVYGY